MGQPNPITTGEQTVAATGAITGSLVTATLPRTGVIYVRVRGLTGAQSIQIALQDTANVTPFSDALNVFVFDFLGAQPTDGTTKSIEVFNLPDMRFGATNTALRVNATAITGSTSCSVEAWLEQ